ncbi:MAG: hypothetical protein N3A38_15255, partial [Planctomycetota bacterium]|nr:hypothetical protein [Planctomycetota bacterium]
PELRRKMGSHAARMRSALAKRGIRVVSDGTPIIAMEFGDGRQAAEASRHFLKFDLVIPYFRYASEPRENLLRAAARACYSGEDLARFEEAVAALPPP